MKLQELNKQQYLKQLYSMEIFKDKNQFEDFVKGFVIDVYENRFNYFVKKMNLKNFQITFLGELENLPGFINKNLNGLMNVFGRESFENMQKYIEHLDYENDDVIQVWLNSQCLKKVEELGGYKMILEEVGIEAKGLESSPKSLRESNQQYLDNLDDLELN